MPYNPLWGVDSCTLIFTWWMIDVWSDVQSYANQVSQLLDRIFTSSAE